MPTGKDGGGKPAGACTTQRVDLDTVNRIKTINYHLYKSKGIRISQADLLAYAMRFTLSKEADFIEYVMSDKETPIETPFDTLVKATGKPWFPYGNIFKID
jgi:hypothetical protein